MWLVDWLIVQFLTSFSSFTRLRYFQNNLIKFLVKLSFNFSFTTKQLYLPFNNQCTFVLHTSILHFKSYLSLPLTKYHLMRDFKSSNINHQSDASIQRHNHRDSNYRSRHENRSNHHSINEGYENNRNESKSDNGFYKF